MNKLLKVISIGLGLLLIFGTILIFVLTTSPGEQLIKKWLESRLSAEIGLAVNIGRLETNLWSRVQIDTLVISPISGFEKQPVLYIGNILVNYSISDLLGESINFKALFVDSVVVAVKTDSLGQYGIPILDTKTSEAETSTNKSSSISVETLSLNRIALLYDDSKIPSTVKLTGAEITARGQKNGLIAGEIKINSITAVYNDLTFALNDFETSISLEDNQLRCDYARVDCDGIQLEANGNINFSDTTCVSFDINAKGTPGDLTRSIAIYFDLSSFQVGYFKINSRINGLVNDLSADLNAEIYGFSMHNTAIDSVKLQAYYYADNLSLDTLQISVYNGLINGIGSTRFDSIGETSLNLKANLIDIPSLWKTVYSENSPYQGKLNGNIIAQGQLAKLDTWVGEASLTGTNLQYLNHPISQLQCALTFNSGKTEFSLFHEADTIQAEIELINDNLRGIFEISVPDLTALARFIDQPELSGCLQAHGTVDGSFSNPAINANIVGHTINYRNFPVDSIDATISYFDSNLTIVKLVCNGNLDSIDSRKPPFGLDSIGGSLTYASSMSGDMDGLSGNVTVKSIAPQYRSYALDSLSLEAALEKSIFEITELSANFKEKGAQLNAIYDTLTKAGSFNLMLYPTITATSQDVDLSENTIDTRDNFGSVNGNFSLQPDSKLFGTIHGQGLWLGLISLFTPDSIVSDGELEFDLAVDGPMLAPQVHMAALMRSPKVSGYLIDSITTRLRINNNTFFLDSLVSYAFGNELKASAQLGLHISSDGFYDINGNSPITAELSSNEFDLSVLEGLIMPAGEIGGTFSALLKAGGILSAPRFEGNLVARDGRFRFEESLSPVENISLDLLFTDSILTINHAQWMISNTSIEASGSLTSTDYQSARVDLEVGVGTLGRLGVNGTVSDTNVNTQIYSNSLNLVVLQPFVTEIDSLQGRLSCDILIAGQLTAPQIDGSLNLSSLSARSLQNHIIISNGSAEIRFDKNQVILDSVLASFNDGRLFTSGNIIYDQGELQDINLTLRADKITLQKPESYSMTVDSCRLIYGKQQENYILDGDVVLGEARLMAGLRATSILPWIRAFETVDFELPELIARSRLNVRIRESDRIWIDNNLARIRLRTELGIIGTALRPNFTGLVRVEEGYLLYLDRRFKVNNGLVYFNDPIRFNPDIKLDATTQVTAYRRTTAEPYLIYIKAEGLLDQLQYGLYSEPPLDKPDIVALLTLGATRTELTGSGEGNGQGGLTDILKDRAAMLTSKRVSGYLSRRAGAFFGFDEFTIEGNLFRFDNTWGPQLVASKRLSRRVDFTYSTTVGHLNDQAVRLGYRLTPRFSIQGETDRLGRSGLDIKYGISFK